MNNLITLTQINGKSIMIGVPQIIDVHEVRVSEGKTKIDCTKIKSVGAMVETNYVLETIEEIQKLILHK
jgi:hypothetical protein